jgi:hypothetical protein
MCDNWSCHTNETDPAHFRGDALDLTLLDKALAHVTHHPLEWDQAVAPGLEGAALAGTARSFVGHALWLGGIEVPVLARSSGSVWLDSAHALAVVADVTGACREDLEVLVHPRARIQDLARAIDWIRVGLSTEDVISEVESRPHGARTEPTGQLGEHGLAELLSMSLAEPDLAADLGGQLADHLGGLSAAAWFGLPSTPDILLLEQALAFVAEHPLQWDQGTWQSDGLFGPVRCIGGHALAMCGYRIDPLDPERATSPDGVVGTTMMHVTTRLGLSEEDAAELFSLSDLDTLAELVLDIGAEAADHLRSGLT